MADTWSRLPVVVVALAAVALTTAACGPSATPQAGGPRTARSERPAHPPIQPWVIRVEHGGRLAGSIIEGPVREVEHLLGRPGPTTVAQVQALWTRLDGFAAGMARNAELGAEPGSHALPEDVVRALEAASAEVAGVADEVLARIVHWDERSSLAAIARLWRPVADELFAVEADRQRAAAATATRRDERDPPQDSDLRAIVAELGRIAAACRAREEWDHAFTLEVQAAVANRRPRPEGAIDPRRRIPFEPYQTTDARPVELRRALGAIDDARAVLSDAAGIYFWNEDERARRLADEVARHVARAEEALASLP